MDYAQDSQSPLRNTGFSVALVLSGGNALAAYQGGAYQALHEAGLRPDWVSGASAGAINGALICGNPVDARLEAIRRFWQPAGHHRAPDRAPSPATERLRRTAAAAEVMAGGRPGLFVPRRIWGPWWNPFGNKEPSSLYNSTPLRTTLEKLVDFELLNTSPIRFTAGAVDLETGEDIVFDTRSFRLSADHIRASAALLPAFSPVEIDGRQMGDAGISANLPLDAVLSDFASGPADRPPLLCIAIDLLPLRGSRPATLGDAACRMQDLIFATQSRRALAAWQAIFDEREKRGSSASITVIHIAYSDQQNEVSGKAFDFSAETIASRWQSGYRDMAEALRQFAPDSVGFSPGFSLYQQVDGALQPVRLSLHPTEAGQNNDYPG